jgi:ABC-type transporter Mla maintaining outer membrane lipid asymmetry ATPase subunit MlaF
LCKDGKGLIAVTHKVSDAMKMAERFMFLKDGMILFDGNKESLLDSNNEEIHRFIRE